MAGIVKRSDGTWMAIDPEYDKPITIREWYKEVKAMDADDKLQIFVSNGNRWSPSSSDSYSPEEFDPQRSDPKAEATYNNYFKDLMENSREEAAEVKRQRSEENSDSED